MTEVTSSVDALVARLLDDHLLAGPRPGQCVCGFGGADMPIRYLGRPHSVHVAEVLREAGVLKEGK
jgi:hypothetical protein